MGRKKKLVAERAARAAEAEDEWDDDGASAYSADSGASGDTSASAKELRAEKIDTDCAFAVGEAIGNLSEKRASTREGALKTLQRLLARRPDLLITAGTLDRHSESLAEDLVNCIKRGKPREAQLACKVIRLVTLTNGAGDEELYQEVEATLKSTVHNSPSAPVRADALRTLGLCCYVASTEDSSTWDCVELCVELFVAARNPVPEEVQIAALQTWGLLATSLEPSYLTSRCFEELLPVFSSHLQASATRAAQRRCRSRD